MTKICESIGFVCYIVRVCKLLSLFQTHVITNHFVDGGGEDMAGGGLVVGG